MKGVVERHSPITKREGDEQGMEVSQRKELHRILSLVERDREGGSRRKGRTGTQVKRIRKRTVVSNVDSAGRKKLLRSSKHKKGKNTRKASVVGERTREARKKKKCIEGRADKLGKTMFPLNSFRK